MQRTSGTSACSHPGRPLLVGCLLLALLPQQRGGYTPTAASAPSTDIWLAEIGRTDDGPYRVGAPRNVTDRDGYDNQPAFEPGGTTFLFTSVRDTTQSDVYRFDIVNDSTVQVTRTAASEYSPTPMPNGGFSAINESTSGQFLWRYDADGTDRGVIFSSVEPVGYHAWGDDDHAVMFVLGGDGRPATLQLGSVAADAAEVIAENPGRSLHRVPGREAVSFVRKVTDDEWWIEVLDLETTEFTRLLRTLPGREDYAWTPEGTLIAGDGGRLFQTVAGDEWLEIADLSAAGLQDISRLAINGQGTHIAIVTNR